MDNILINKIIKLIEEERDSRVPIALKVKCKNNENLIAYREIFCFEKCIGIIKRCVKEQSQ